MGKLECTVCGGVIECPTFAEAVDSLDHGIGLTKGRPCPNDGQHLVWNGKPVDPKNAPKETTIQHKFTTTTDTSSHTFSTSGTVPKKPKGHKTKKSR